MLLLPVFHVRPCNSTSSGLETWSRDISSVNKRYLNSPMKSRICPVKLPNHVCFAHLLDLHCFGRITSCMCTKNTSTNNSCKCSHPHSFNAIFTYLFCCKNGGNMLPRKQVTLYFSFFSEILVPIANGLGILGV